MFIGTSSADHREGERTAAWYLSFVAKARQSASAPEEAAMISSLKATFAAPSYWRSHPAIVLSILKVISQRISI